MNWLKLQMATGAVWSACLKLDGNVDGRQAHTNSILGFHFDTSS